MSVVNAVVVVSLKKLRVAAIAADLAPQFFHSFRGIKVGFDVPMIRINGDGIKL
jgi:hypothetical protein